MVIRTMAYSLVLVKKLHPYVTVENDGFKIFLLVRSFVPKYSISRKIQSKDYRKLIH